MQFTVIWIQAALDALALTWMQAVDRTAVQLAADRADRELQVDADVKGVEFYGDRLLVIDRLHICYRVDVQARQVTVLDVW